MKKRSILNLACAVAVFLMAETAMAANLFSSGAKTWDTTTANWGTTAGGPYTALTWTNANNDTAVFEGSSGTVTLGEAISVGGLTFNTSGYNITGNTLAFGAANNTIAFNNIAAATITGTIGGSGSCVTLDGGGYAGQTAGTLTLNGTSAGGWSGTTTNNNGMTMSLSGLNQALLNTAGITLNNGGITLTCADSDAEKTLDRVSDSATITANGGTITYTTTTAGSTRIFAETVGTNALTSGQLNLVQTLNKTAGSQTLTLADLTQSGTAAITFSSPALNATINRIKVTGKTGAGTGQNLPGGVVIGPWATAGTAANNQNDYAVYDASGYILPANITASAETTWTTAANAYTLTIPAKTAAALSATRNITALKESSTATATSANTVSGSPNFTIASGHSFVVGDPVVLSSFGADLKPFNVGRVYYVASITATTFTLAATPGGAAINAEAATSAQFTGGLKLDNTINLGTYGILNSGNAPFAIGRTAAGGNVTLPTAGAGNLYLTTGLTPNTAYNNGLNGRISIEAPIVDNDGALTLVKNGAGVLRLQGVNTYTGGTVINAGTVIFTDGTSGKNFGTGSITFNGSGALSFGPNSSWAFAGGGTIDLSRPIALNNGAIAAFYYNSPNTTMNITGAITGDGGITVGKDPVVTYNGGDGTITYNTFSSTGHAFTGPLIMTSGHALTFNSLADGPGSMILGANFTYGSGAAANMSVPNRLVDVRGNITIANSSGSQTVTLGAVSTTTTGAKTLTLGNGGAGGFVVGPISNGSGTIAVNKTGTGDWTLSGTNTYSGITGPDNTTLTIRGKPALSPNSIISFDSSNGSAGAGSGRLNLLMDDAGTVSLGNQVNVRTAQTSGGVTAQWMIFAGNNGGATTGSTLVLGKMNFASITDPRAGGYILNVTGANSYGLQIGNVDLAPSVGRDGGTGSGTFQPGQGFNPTTAPLAITGTVRQNAASVAASGSYADRLILWGSHANNTISGSIMDPADYPSNVNAKPLNVTKSSSSTWTLSGTNTYSGTTTISGGTLVLSGINTGSGATLLTAGKLVSVVGGSCSNSDVYVSAGTNSISVTDTTKSWACRSLSYPAAATLEFAFGANTPNTSVAPLQVGNVAFPVAPAVNITGSSLPDGTYPLITWTGFISGGAPSTVTVAGTNGTLVVDTANKTLWLTIPATSPSSSKQPLTWQGGAGSTWVTNDTSFSWWKDATPVFANYQESLVGGITVGDNVVFSNAPGGTVTINTTVSPASVLVAGTSNYTFSGSSIGGGGALTKTGAGTLTLSSANSYSGGTRLSAGTLSLANDNALGAGGITLNGGTIQSSDDTARTLANPVVLNGSSTIGGTGNLNFTTGAGLVTANSTIAVTNSSVTTTFGGPIDGAYGITKTGAGTLSLTGTNTSLAGLTVNGGTLNMQGNYASGPITIGNAANANTFNVLPGGAVNMLGNSTIGSNAGLFNSLVVNGGTVTNVSGTLSIGVAYSPITYGNSLTISNGAKWYGGSVAVGVWTTSNGQNTTNNSYNVGGFGDSSTVSNGAITVGYINGTPSGLSIASYNRMTVTNATISVGGALTIGQGGGNSGRADGNSVWVLNGGTVNVLGGNGINIGAVSGNTLVNTLVISNGGYVSGGLLTLGGGSSNSVQVLNGGQLVTAGATIGGGNFAQLTGGGSGPTPTWSVVGSNILFNGNSGTLTVDGAGTAGGAVATNVNQLQIGYTSSGSANNSVVLANGARMFSTNTISVGYTDAGITGTTSGNTLTIAGGAAGSLLNAGGAALQVAVIGTGNNGNTPTVINNQVLIGTGGILTNAGSVFVGYNSVVGQYGTTTCYVTNNQMMVTGGQLYSRGTSYIGYAANAGGLSPINSYNSATITGVNSLWDLGGATLYVGYSAKSTATVRNNSLTVGSGGVLTNAGHIAVGFFSSGICQSNTVTVSNANVSATILTVASNNTLSLGPGGQIYANAVTNAGTLAVGLDKNVTPACGRLTVNGNLNLNNARLDVSIIGTPTEPCVIATYGTLIPPGVFAATNGLSDKYRLEMKYKGLNQIAIVYSAAGTVIRLK